MEWAVPAPRRNRIIFRFLAQVVAHVESAGAGVARVAGFLSYFRYWRSPARRAKRGRAIQGRGTPVGWVVGGIIGKNHEIRIYDPSQAQAQMKKRERQTPRRTSRPGGAHRIWANAAGPPRAAARPRGG